MAVAARLNDVTVVNVELVARCRVMLVALVPLFTQDRLTCVALAADAVNELGAAGAVPPVEAGVVTVAVLDQLELPAEFKVLTR